MKSLLTTLGIIHLGKCVLDASTTSAIFIDKRAVAT